MKHYFEDNGILRVLQAGRAIAACSVVVHHAATAASVYNSAVPDWIHELSRRSVGFNFFFVLSGFIILYAHGADKSGKQAAITFTLKRITRVFGPYLPIAIAMMLLYWALPTFSRGYRDWGVFSTLTLIPSNQESAVMVAWTLQHELIFYAIFVLFYFIRPFWMVVAAWGAMIVALWISGLWAQITIPVFTVALHPLNLMFMAGMICAAFVKHTNNNWWPLPMLLGVAGAIIFLREGNSLEARVGFGLAMAPLTMALIMLERARRIHVPNWTVALGSASYAIYLVHYPVISVMARAVDFADSWYATFFSVIVGGIFVGIAYYAIFERRLMKYVKSRIAKRASKAREDYPIVPRN